MSGYPLEPVRMRVVSHPLHVAAVRAAVERACGDMGFDHECAAQVGLCVHEALANIIEHAYEGRHDRPIDVEIGPSTEKQVEGIRLVLRDYGRPVDPGQLRRTASGPSEEGGYGVRIIKTCMDAVDYERAGEGGTRLTMTKRLRQQGTGQGNG